MWPFKRKPQCEAFFPGPVNKHHYDGRCDRRLGHGGLHHTLNGNWAGQFGQFWEEDS